MKLLAVLLVLDCFISLENFYLVENSLNNSRNIRSDRDNFNHKVTRKVSKPSISCTTAYKENLCHNKKCGYGEFFPFLNRFKYKWLWLNRFNQLSQINPSKRYWRIQLGPVNLFKELYSFNCKCRNNWRNPNNQTECISWFRVCDGIVDCHDGEDEIDCHCSEDEFQCNPCDSPIRCTVNTVVYNPYQCLPWNHVKDGINQCANNRDETPESDFVTQLCVNGKWKCNGIINCPYLTPHDEFNCSGCPSKFAIPCDCYKQKNKCNGYGRVCYNERMRCDGYINCVDGSDELGCSCNEEEFQCTCYKADPIECRTIHGPLYKQCIPLSMYYDGKRDCLDGSDEAQYENVVQCKNNDITLRRLPNVEKCVEASYFSSGSVELFSTSCENSTCYKVPSLNCSSVGCNTTDLLCVSQHSLNNLSLCRNPFQCNDGSLLLTNKFCDGIYDCPDLSDEILSGPGFKCSGTSGYCVLPQRNLYDNIPQCKVDSDLNCTSECFTCLDNRLLISLKQVCDGVFDCYDLSDECLCQINVGNTLCNSVFPKKSSTINNCNYATNISENIIQETKLSKHFCHSNKKFNPIFNSAILCDSNPECADFSDECNCENPPAFCNDSCHKFYLMGDRYCDGIVDQSWKLINKSICPEGFDETNCPNRFMCKAGNYVSVDIFQKCDGATDCDDGEDEEGCNQSMLFSSNEEMIANTGLKACFWIMSILVISGNIYVIITSVLYFKQTKDKKGVKLQRLIILNISIADMIMGIYLLIISIYSVVYSGFYGEVDHSWRSSLKCSIVGSLTILSSEASCFLMVLLSIFRLKQIVNPFYALTMWTKPWKIGIGLAWLISAIFAFIPIFHVYFVKEIWFANEFMSSRTTWDKVNITNFACRLAQLTNKTTNGNGKDWELIKMFLKTNFPEYAPKGEFGYFGETSICMPRFYAAPGDKAWEYTLAIITLNFIAFLCIAISYVVLYKRASKRSKAIQNKSRAKKSKNTQNRIARIILTDFFCWIPICITSYVKLAGHDVPNEFYIYSAALLLPINSALNPFLFSPIIDKIIEKIKSHRKDNGDNIRMENMT